MTTRCRRSSVRSRASRSWVCTATISQVQRSQEIGPAAIVIFSIGSALAGWGLLALLERLTSGRATLVWTVIAVVVLILLMLPLLSMSAGAAVALALIHLVVGAAIIAAMRLSAPDHPQTAPAVA